jgi:SAM-dependent methyltransferase
MFFIEYNYWWFFGRNYIISTLFKEYRFERENLKILNAGCGTGGLFKFLSKYSENYFGMDISEHALFFSKNRNISKLCKGDILHIPFKDESFSIIFVLDVMEHLENYIRAMHEIFRILKKNSFFFLLFPLMLFCGVNMMKYWDRKEDII